jgi:hypothetical protein
MQKQYIYYRPILTLKVGQDQQYTLYMYLRGKEPTVYTKFKHLSFYISRYINEKQKVSQLTTNF